MVKAIKLQKEGIAAKGKSCVWLCITELYR